jgi:serine phosphatase RsbU (regulator of sigma subunit)
VTSSGRGDEARPSAERPPARAQTWLFSIALVALVLGTAGGVLYSRNQALAEVDERAERTGRAVAAVLEVELRQVAARMAGAAVVVADDGSLDPARFAPFADDPVAGERAGPMVLLDEVPGDERPAYEAELGAPIRAGVEPGAPPAPPAAVHYPASAAAGAIGGRTVIGVDFGADPDRRGAIERAAAAGRSAVSGAVELPSTGQQGVAVVRPVVDPDGVRRGFVATGIALTDLDEAIDEAHETGAVVALLAGGELITGDPFAAREPRAAVSIELPGHDWVVAVRPGNGADFSATWAVAVAGLVATATMGALLVVTARHQRRLRRANEGLARSEARTRAVQDVTGRLARALTGSQVASALIDHLPRAVGASVAVVATLDRAGRVELLQPGSGPRLLPAPAAGSVVGEVIATGSPAWLASPLGWRGDVLAAEVAGDARSLAVLPLHIDDVVGFLAVGYGGLHLFEEDEQSLLQTAAVLAGRALARGRRYDAEHHAAVAFQEAALPAALPEVPGLAIAARYRPAVHGATVGGDWYDALVLDEGRALLVVGDVVGHGMDAAAAMGRLRTAFQTIVPFGDDPGAMLQGISQQIDSIPNAFCTTAVSAVVDVASGVMRWARAGHPPPLVVSPGREVALLDAPSLPPLGVAPDQVPAVHERLLTAGDVVVLYTDGLVERRDESLDEGFQRLASVVEDLVDLDVGDLADALVTAMVPDEGQADDLAVLVVRFQPGGRGQAGAEARDGSMASW